MKQLVILGVNLQGKRTSKAVTGDTKAIVTNPEKYGFKAISAVMTAQAFQQTLEG